MEELRRMRGELGWSQQRLANESGVNKATINQVEQGKRSPSLATLERLATAMRVEVADFFPKVEPRLWSDEGAARPGTQVTVNVDHLNSVLAETVRQQREFRLHELNLKLARATTDQERADAHRNLQNWWTAGTGHVLINLYQEIPELMDGALVREEALSVERVKEFARSVFVDKGEGDAELRHLEEAFRDEARARPGRQ